MHVCVKSWFKLCQSCSLDCKSRFSVQNINFIYCLYSFSSLVKIRVQSSTSTTNAVYSNSCFVRTHIFNTGVLKKRRQLSLARFVLHLILLARFSQSVDKDQWTKPLKWLSPFTVLRTGSYYVKITFCLNALMSQLSLYFHQEMRTFHNFEALSESVRNRQKVAYVSRLHKQITVLQ